MDEASMMSDAPQAWTTWMAEHGPALILLARQWAGRHADAEDIVQDGFVRFWGHRSGVRDPAAYLYVCVRNAALDWIRKKRKLPLDLAGSEVDGAHHRSAEPWFEPAELPVEQEYRRAVLERALMALPIEQRQVVVMKIWGGLTFAALGQVLEISPNTAASRYRYALESLRAKLASALTE